MPLERQHAVDIPLVASDVTGLSANLSPQFGCFQGHEGMHGRTPNPVTGAGNALPIYAFVGRTFIDFPL